MNSTSEVRYTRLAPKRRAAQPVTGITAASDEQVAGHDPLDLRDRAVQVVPEGAQRDVDDRRVEDRHDHAEDHDARDPPHV